MRGRFAHPIRPNPAPSHRSHRGVAFHEGPLGGAECNSPSDHLCRSPGPVDDDWAGCNSQSQTKKSWENHGKPQSFIVSQSPAYSQYISGISSYRIPILSLYYPYSALVLTCFDALALDFGRIDFRSLLANDYRHGIAVRREDFRLGKPRWQHGAKV